MADKVAIIKCPSYEEQLVTSALREMLDHWGGMQTFVSPGQRVLIKPNMLTAAPPENLATTHPAVIAGTIQLVKEAGGLPLVGDRPIKISAAHVAKLTGIEEVCTRYGAQIIEFTSHCKVDSCDDKYYGTLGMAREVLEADVIINLAKLKAHDQLLLTLGVKNMFGGVGLWRRAWRHFISKDRLEDFTRMVLSTYHLAPPAFTIIDGIVAMERSGPGNGDAKQIGLLVGGPNAIAADRVFTEILSCPWEDLPTLKAAQQMGFSGCNLSHIELCGAPLEQVKIKDFKFPQLAPIEFSLLRSIKMVIRKIWKKLAASIRGSAPK